ncbi:DUF190 domain-containing protein [Methylomonas paludis]|uniref:DUF190 domain-containing protein n=1 Tax=Methylomonas paludis TaxID=1173101 RepID=A0A975MLR4_9GAMM|nr:DUF190 domain-containing protein [Methylomonas paludis]QWF70137.1 DUF190 domain-containing protein [Methylomonas paludis]
MATKTVTIVRVYLREGENLLSDLLKFLHDEVQVSGVTVVRGIAGFGADGKLHLSSLSDLSLDLPLIVEFYDTPERISPILQALESQPGITHVISWQSTCYIKQL